MKREERKMEGFKKFLVKDRGYSEEEADKLLATLKKDERMKQKSKREMIAHGLRQIQDSIREVILLWNDLEEEMEKEGNQKQR
jgi:hypothetical protein